MTRTIRLRATTVINRVYEVKVYDGETVKETVEMEQGIYKEEPADYVFEVVDRSSTISWNYATHVGLAED